ncbi:MAG: alpha/beta hydrolase [Gemmatimonadota bacterium]|nr:alpha/beta hydrolase [Gemmatimonadota bacterium]
MSELIVRDGLVIVAERPVTVTRPPVLLVHGLFGAAWYFERYQHFLARRGHASYAVNLRGHAGSRPVADLGRTSIVDYVADAEEAMRAAADDSAGALPIVIGHSMGGLIVQKMLETVPAKAAVLLCSAPPRGIHVLGWQLMRKQMPYLGDILRSRTMTPDTGVLMELMGSRFTDGERASIRDGFVPDSGLAGREMLLGSITVDAARVKTPLLVIGAGRDRLVPPGVAAKIARRYKAPLVMHEQMGHFLVMEAGWEKVAEGIADWIA